MRVEKSKWGLLGINEIAKNAKIKETLEDGKKRSHCPKAVMLQKTKKMKHYDVVGINVCIIPASSNRSPMLRPVGALPNPPMQRRPVGVGCL